MANNRMDITCPICQESFRLAKYYPTLTRGWFVPFGAWPVEGETPVEMNRRHLGESADFVIRLDAFLEKHSHCDTQGVPSMYGNRQLALTYEEPPDGAEHHG